MPDDIKEREKKVLKEIYESNARERARRIKAFDGEKLEGNEPVVIPCCVVDDSTVKYLLNLMNCEDTCKADPRLEYSPEEFTKWFSICRGAEEAAMAAAENYMRQAPKDYDGRMMVIEETRRRYCRFYVGAKDWARFEPIHTYYIINLNVRYVWGALSKGTYYYKCKNIDEMKAAELRYAERERAIAAKENGIYIGSPKPKESTLCTNGSFLINPNDYDTTSTASEYSNESFCNDASCLLTDNFEHYDESKKFAEEMICFHNDIQNRNLNGKESHDKIIMILHDEGNVSASLNDAIKIYDGIRRDKRKTTYEGIRKVLGIKARSLEELTAKK